MISQSIYTKVYCITGLEHLPNKGENEVVNFNLPSLGLCYTDWSWIGGPVKSRGPTEVVYFEFK